MCFLLTKEFDYVPQSPPLLILNYNSTCSLRTLTWSKLEPFRAKLFDALLHSSFFWRCLIFCHQRAGVLCPGTDLRCLYPNFVVHNGHQKCVLKQDRIVCSRRTSHSRLKCRYYNWVQLSMIDYRRRESSLWSLGTSTTSQLRVWLERMSTCAIHN